MRPLLFPVLQAVVAMAVFTPPGTHVSVKGTSTLNTSQELAMLPPWNPHHPPSPPFEFPRDQSANEFLDYGCKDVMVIYARDTAQPGNIGRNPGPELHRRLKIRLRETMAMQGVSYSAGPHWATMPERCDPIEASELKKQLEVVVTRCLGSRFVVSGHGQGAALIHFIFEGFPPKLMDRIIAVVTFGDPRYNQDMGVIPGSDPENTLILCKRSDPMCRGGTIASLGHRNYTIMIPEATNFIIRRLQETDPSGNWHG